MAVYVTVQLVLLHMGTIHEARDEGMEERGAAEDPERHDDVDNVRADTEENLQTQQAACG